MLEIFILIGIGRGMASMADRKGRNKAGYGFLGVVLWILGEILGFVVGVVLVNATDASDIAPLLIYGCALGGAVIGAVIAFSILGMLPAIPRDDDYYRGPYDRTDVRRAEYRRGRPERTWCEEDQPPPAEGDNITDRPSAAPPEPREDDRVTE